MQVYVSVKYANMHEYFPVCVCVCARVCGTHFILHIAAFQDMVYMILSCFPGYTINIYVEMFHSEKQFDELEIFDGM